MSDLMQLLDMAKDADASQCRQAIGLFTARLRELGATSPSPWHQPTPHVPQGLEPCSECGIISANHALDGHHEHVNPQTRAAGLELQAGLEEAVRRETARLDGGNDEL